MSKVKVFHFHNGHGGGVLAVIKNLIKFSTNGNIENHIIFTINENIHSNYIYEEIEGVVSQQLFYYKANNSFYYTCRQLAKLLPDDAAIIVAHDWIELGMASNLGLQNPVVQVVHGNYDYYFDLAVKHTASVDAFICISQKIFTGLISKLPLRNKDIFCSHFPVPYVEAKKITNNLVHIIYYAGDLKDNNKQLATVIKIADQLNDGSGNYLFTIAGGGMAEAEFFAAWPATMKQHVNFLGSTGNKEILALLPLQDIFLLPSCNEGLPVSVVEAMKAGVVPLVTRWDGSGIEELIMEGATGYYFEIAAVDEYVACIKNLHHNRQLLSAMSFSCIEKATDLFDPLQNTINFENILIEASKKTAGKKRALKVYGSRLDHPLIPNFITSLLRKKK